MPFGAPGTGGLGWSGGPVTGLSTTMSTAIGALRLPAASRTSAATRWGPFASFVVSTDNARSAAPRHGLQPGELQIGLRQASGVCAGRIGVGADSLHLGAVDLQDGLEQAGADVGCLERQGLHAGSRPCLGQGAGRRGDGWEGVVADR